MIHLILFAVLATGGQPLPEADPLKAVLQEMEAADCCRFEFLSIVDSDVFDTVDSTQGVAMIATDGRYRVALGSDEYLQTSDTLYSYSTEHNQVTIEPSAAGGDGGQISFLKRLETFYWIAVDETGATYHLSNRNPEVSSLPKTMTLALSSEAQEIAWLEYTDDNGDLNRIIFLERTYLEECEATELMPDFGPTVEIIKLY